METVEPRWNNNERSLCAVAVLLMAICMVAPPWRQAEPQSNAAGFMGFAGFGVIGDPPPIPGGRGGGVVIFWEALFVEIGAILILFRLLLFCIRLERSRRRRGGWG